MKMAEIIVKQVKSSISCSPKQRKNLRALGLRKLGAERKHQDTAVIKGMIRKVDFLVTVTKSG